jgi:hypothetical protein
MKSTGPEGPVTTSALAMRTGRPRLGLEKLLLPSGKSGKVWAVEKACCALCGRAAPRLTRHHLVPRTLHKRTRTRRKFSRAERHTVVLLCRTCHKQIHAVFTEPELARDYTSVEALATHPEIAHFLEWIARQPPTADVPVRRRRARRGSEKDGRIS